MAEMHVAICEWCEKTEELQPIELSGRTAWGVPEGWWGKDFCSKLCRASFDARECGFRLVPIEKDVA